MYRIAKLLCGFLPGLKRTEIGVVRFVAVCTPETLHFASICIEDRDALVAIAVSYVGLIGIGIDRHLSNAAKIDGAQAVGVGAGGAVLSEELAIARKFQNVRIAASVTTDPDVVLVINRDAMVGGRAMCILRRGRPSD